MNKHELINELSVDVGKYILNYKKDITKLFFNDELSDIPYILGAILDEELHEQNNLWIELEKKWIDDVLVSKVNITKYYVEFWGITIWGKNKTTEQWTDPLYFKIYFDNNKIMKILILFKDANSNSLAYTKFNKNRYVWSKDYYLDSNFNPDEIEWENKIDIIT